MFELFFMREGKMKVEVGMLRGEAKKNQRLSMPRVLWLENPRHRFSCKENVKIGHKKKIGCFPTMI